MVFFVELREVVVDDESLVQVEPRLLGPGHGAIVESDDAALQGRVVDAQRTARFDLGIEAVLGRALEILDRELLPVLGLEPLVRDFPVPEILVHDRSAVDDGRDAMILQHLGAQAPAPRPRVHGARDAILHGRAHYRSEIRRPGRRPGDEDAGIVLVASGVASENPRPSGRRPPPLPADQASF